MNRNKKQYDCIFVDAFDFLETPFQMATREAILKIYGSLNDGGCVFVNVISSAEGEGSKILSSIFATYKSVFPQVYVMKTDSKAPSNQPCNFVLVGLKNDIEPLWSDPDPEFDAYLKTRMDQDINNDALVLTDDYAPLEKYVLEFLKLSSTSKCNTSCKI